MGNIRPFEKSGREHLIADEHGRSSMRSSSPVMPPLVRSYDHEDDQSPRAKKSVLAKVKEKAKRWRNTLGKKKHGQDGGSTTPSWGGNSEEEDDQQDGDSEYYGAPMYESELTTGAHKETWTAQHPASPLPLAEKQILMKAKSSEMGGKNLEITAWKAVTKSEDMVTPACDHKQSKLTHVAASKTEAPPVVATLPTEAQPVLATGTTKEASSSTSEQSWDKGISVRTYLMQKLEPGEEERALSQVISEAMSPSKAGNNGEMGVVEKVKEAVSSLLGMEEQPPKASVTINPRAEIIEEREERILQTN